MWIVYAQCSSILFQDDTTKFQLVYVDKAMVTLFEQFGAYLFLDATYRVCRYRFNLFNILVKTPLRFVVSILALWRVELYKFRCLGTEGGGGGGEEGEESERGRGGEECRGGGGEEGKERKEGKEGRRGRRGRRGGGEVGGGGREECGGGGG